MAMTVHLLSSCHKEKPEVTKPDFALSAQVQALEYNGTSIWGKQGELGVFVAKSRTTDILEGNDNLKYTTTFQTQTTRLTPADQKMNLPKNGNLADIIAYYPYIHEFGSKGSSKTVYAIDLQDQKARNPDILLIGRANDCSTTINSATVSLKPVLAKLNVKLKNQHATKSSEEDIRIQLSKIRCKAEIDVLNGTYISYGEAETTDMIQPSESVYAYEAILPAHTTEAEARLTVIFPESARQDPLAVNLYSYVSEFKPNSQYDLEVTVSPEGIKAVLVSMSEFSVTDWYEDKDDIYGNINNK